MEIKINRRKGDPVTMLFDECDLHLISERKLFMGRDGYVFSRTKNQKGQTYIHRVIMCAKPGEVVDHINGVKTDNRRENLRICTHSENIRNSKPYGMRKYKGVTFSKHHKMFKSTILSNGKHLHLGYFKIEGDAARAYDRAARYFFKEFANPNFKDDNLVEPESYKDHPPTLNMSLESLLSAKENIRKKIALGDMAKVSKMLNRYSSCVSNWIARKGFTRVDYQYYHAFMQVIEDRERRVSA